MVSDFFDYFEQADVQNFFGFFLELKLFRENVESIRKPQVIDFKRFEIP